jgi:hypothetical protein
MAPRTNQPADTTRLNFTGFPAEGLQFLSDLADHNEPALIVAVHVQFELPTVADDRPPPLCEC